MTRAMEPRQRQRYELLAVIVLVVAVAALVIAAVKVLIVLFAGILFALVLEKISARLARSTRLPYVVWVAGLVVLIVAAVVAAVPLLGPQIADQAAELSKVLPDAARSLVERLHHGPLAPAISPEAAHKLSSPQSSPNVLSAALHALRTSVEAIAGLVVVFFLGVYGAAQPQVYKRAALAITPAKWTRRMDRALDEVGETLARWLLGRFVAMVFVGVTCAIVFSALGLPLPIALAVFAGLMTFIEYIGAILSAIPPILLGLTIGPSTALWVLVLFTGIHLVDGYLLSPLITRVAVHFPPGFTIAGQVIFATLIGFLGLTFSTPLLVVAVVGVKAWRADASAPLPGPADPPPGDGPPAEAESEPRSRPAGGPDDGGPDDGGPDDG